jgi:hypothetical protein
MTKMNYKLNATLLGAFNIEGQRWLILVDQGEKQVQRYVLATYFSGSDEWQSGVYFISLTSAALAFATYITTDAS